MFWGGGCARAWPEEPRRKLGLFADVEGVGPEEEELRRGEEGGDDRAGVEWDGESRDVRGASAWAAEWRLPPFSSTLSREPEERGEERSRLSSCTMAVDWERRDTPRTSSEGGEDPEGLSREGSDEEREPRERCPNIHPEP
jgi:hypothetical protein